ncbi:MAG: hypothetical protein P4L76_01340 [Beijerinckiaceae bacterium]|nr:hypothetical protein [Beijerinckiaceae bacterium]
MGRSSRFLVFLSVLALMPAIDVTPAAASGRLASNRFVMAKHAAHHRGERQAGGVLFGVGPLPEPRIAAVAGPSAPEGFNVGFPAPCVHPLIIHVRHRPSRNVKIPRVVYGAPPCGV